MTVGHVAQFNFGRLKADWDDPAVAPFVKALGGMSTLARRSPGFVWRMPDEEMEAAQLDPHGPLGGDPRIASTLSVWETVEQLRHFVHDTLHGRYLLRRLEWFEPHDGQAYVLWHIEPGHRPGIEEAADRLAHLARHGPTAHAFELGWEG